MVRALAAVWYFKSQVVMWKISVLMILIELEEEKKKIPKPKTQSLPPPLSCSSSPHTSGSFRARRIPSYPPPLFIAEEPKQDGGFVACFGLGIACFQQEGGCFAC